MKYFIQFFYILVFCLLGEVLAAVLPLPIPAALYGLVLLFLALCLKIVKPQQISHTAQFFISIMGVLFVAPIVRIVEYWEIISSSILAIVVICLFPAVLVFLVSGWVTQQLLKRGGKDNA